MKARRVAVWTVVTLALLLVFVAYLRPDFAMILANQLWSCF